MEISCVCVCKKMFRNVYNLLFSLNTKGNILKSTFRQRSRFVSDSASDNSYLIWNVQSFSVQSFLLFFLPENVLKRPFMYFENVSVECCLATLASNSIKFTKVEPIETVNIYWLFISNLIYPNPTHPNLT